MPSQMYAPPPPPPQNSTTVITVPGSSSGGGGDSGDKPEAFGFIGGGSLKDWLIIAVVVVVGLSLLGNGVNFPFGGKGPFGDNGGSLWKGITSWMGWFLLHPEAMLVCWVLSFKRVRDTVGITSLLEKLRRGGTINVTAGGVLTRRWPRNAWRMGKQFNQYNDLVSKAGKQQADLEKLLRNNADLVKGNDYRSALRWIKEFGADSQSTMAAGTVQAMSTAAQADIQQQVESGFMTQAEADQLNKGFQDLEKLENTPVAKRSVQKAVGGMKGAANYGISAKSLGMDIRNFGEIMAEGELKDVAGIIQLMINSPDQTKSFMRLSEMRNLSPEQAKSMARNVPDSISPKQLDTILADLPGLGGKDGSKALNEVLDQFQRVAKSAGGFGPIARTPQQWNAQLLKALGGENSPLLKNAAFASTVEKAGGFSNWVTQTAKVGLVKEGFGGGVAGDILNASAKATRGAVKKVIAAAA